MDDNAPEYRAHDENGWLSRYENRTSDQLVGWIDIRAKKYQPGGGQGVRRGTRPMTMEEIRWLDLCIKVGEYVPRPENPESKQPEPFPLPFGMYRVKDTVKSANHLIGKIITIDGSCGWSSSTGHLHPEYNKYGTNFLVSDFEPVLSGKKDLEDYARLHYPPGTVFVSPQDNKTYTVLDSIEHPKYGLFDSSRTNREYVFMYTDHMSQYVYYEGEWGKIVKQADPIPIPTIDNYRKHGILANEHVALGYPAGIQKYVGELPVAVEGWHTARRYGYVAGTRDALSYISGPISKINSAKPETKSTVDSYIQQPVLISQSKKSKSLKIV
jgi:hypothetical protein